jgi:hypothetical protein
MQLIFDLYILERLPLTDSPKNFGSQQRFSIKVTSDGEKLIKYITSQSHRRII